MAGTASGHYTILTRKWGRNMRVMQVIPTSGPGGAETVVSSLCTALSRLGIGVVAVSSGDQPYLFDKLESLGVDTVRLSPGNGRPLVREIIGTYRRFRPDIVQSHMFDASVPAALAGIICRVPVVVTAHSTVYELDTWKRRAINPILGRLASGLVAVSNAVAEAFVAAGVPHRKVTRIYNGVDVTRFNGPRDNGLRQELGIGDGGPVVGMIANIRPAKDHALLIRSTSQVVRRIPGMHLVLAGDAGPADIAGLERLAATFGVADRVHILGLRDDVPAILRSLDLFALASKIEGLPVSIIEAMAAGRPVVASEVGGVRELVEDGTTGFLVPPGNEEAMSDAIIRLLSDKEKLACFGRSAQRRAIDLFSVEAMATAYQSLYRELLS